MELATSESNDIDNQVHQEPLLTFHAINLPSSKTASNDQLTLEQKVSLIDYGITTASALSEQQLECLLASHPQTNDEIATFSAGIRRKFSYPSLFYYVDHFGVRMKDIEIGFTTLFKVCLSISFHTTTLCCGHIYGEGRFTS